MRARYLLPALVLALAWFGYRTVNRRMRADRYLARSGLASVPDTARDFELRGHSGLFETTYDVSFVDTNENIRRWVASAGTRLVVSDQEAIRGLPGRGPDYTIRNDDDCETHIWAGDGSDKRDQHVSVSMDVACSLEQLGEERARDDPAARRGRRFWALANGRVLRLTTERSSKRAERSSELSEDGGATWRPLPLHGASVTAAAGRGDRLWVAAEDEILVSKDAGRTFEALSTQLDAARSSVAVRAAYDAATVWQIVPTPNEGAFLLTKRRVLKVTDDGVVQEHWHLGPASRMALQDFALLESGDVAVTASPPATLLRGAAGGGVLSSDEAGVTPPRLKDRGHYLYLQVPGAELLLAPSVEHDPNIAPGNFARGCSLFRRPFGTTRWRHEQAVRLGNGNWPGNLVSFADGSGRYLISCGVDELFVGDSQLHFTPISLPKPKYPRFLEAAAIGEDIWFGSWDCTAHCGIALSANGSHRVLD